MAHIGSERTNHIAALVLMVIVGILGVYTIGGGHAASRPQLPNTTEGIHIGLGFDYKVANPSTLQGKVDYVWGAKPIPIPGVVIEKYMPFERLPNYPAGQVPDIKTQHPDWIVYQCDKTTPAAWGPDSNLVLDITNPAVRQFQLDYMSAALDQGYSGVSFDNLSQSNTVKACGVYRGGAWYDLGYAAPAKYFNDVTDWAAGIRGMVKQKYPDATLSANLAVGFSGGLANVQRLTASFDNIFDEAGFEHYGEYRLTNAAWQQEVQALEYLNALGKSYLVTGKTVDNNDADNLRWLLANYLLVKGAHSMFNMYTPAHPYGEFIDHPEYHIPIGHPLNARYATQGLQARDYSGGLALVNPSSTATIAYMPTKSYVNTSGQPVSKVTLAPASGVVLLNAPPAVNASPAAAAKPQPKKPSANSASSTNGAENTSPTSTPTSTPSSPPSSGSNTVANEKTLQATLAAQKADTPKLLVKGVGVILAMAAMLITPFGWRP